MRRAEAVGGRGALPGSRRGFALNAVLVMIVLMTMIVTSSVLLTVAGERSAGAERRRARLEAAAEGLLTEMQERLLARAQQVSGALTEADLAVLNARAVPAFPPRDEALRVDPDRTGWRVIEVRDGERIPHDEVPLAAWTDQPRLAYAGTPPAGGLVAARTLVVALYVTVVDPQGGSFRLRRDVAVSQVPPHQHALHVTGDAELCASATPVSFVGGPVRVDGRLYALSCRHMIRYAGGIEARDGVDVQAPSTHVLLGTDGPLPLATVSRAQAEASPAGALAAGDGRVRVLAAAGGAVGPTRRSGAAVAGAGECDEVPAAGAQGCGGGAVYLPSVQVQRTTAGPGTEYASVCGAAYADGCGEVLAAIAYHPWPFLGEALEGVAEPDPTDPRTLWNGLLPDARHERRCTAGAGAEAYRTARCASNRYGFRVDLGAMPALAGGLLSIRAATGQVPDAGAAAAQEIVLLENAATLAGPLTVHAEVPVYVSGNFNTTPHPAYNGPPPAAIHAPWVVLLPNEAREQLRTSAVWDSVPRAGSATPAAEPLRAASNVSLFAVIRTGACRSAGAYRGGAWEGAPAVLGDWSRVGLRIVGAVEILDRTAAGCPGLAAMDAPAPSGTPTLQPASRTLLFDERLLHATFAVPGSWSAGNLPTGGVAALPGRTATRQRRATGGTVVVRRLHDHRRGRPPIPRAVAIPPLPALPPAHEAMR